MMDYIDEAGGFTRDDAKVRPTCCVSFLLHFVLSRRGLDRAAAPRMRTTRGAAEALGVTFVPKAAASQLRGSRLLPPSVDAAGARRRVPPSWRSSVTPRPARADAAARAARRGGAHARARHLAPRPQAREPRLWPRRRNFHRLHRRLRPRQGGARARAHGGRHGHAVVRPALSQGVASAP